MTFLSPLELKVGQKFKLTDAFFKENVSLEELLGPDVLNKLDTYEIVDTRKNSVVDGVFGEEYMIDVVGVTVLKNTRTGDTIDVSNPDLEPEYWAIFTSMTQEWVEQSFGNI